MKRLMISGFGCPKEPWISFLGPGTTVLTLHEVLEATRTSDMSTWGHFVAEEIRRLRPASIIAHDFGGVMALKALLELQERKIRVHARLTLLNTAFRDFDVLKNPHPFLIQIAPWSLTSSMIKLSGGTVDPQLEPWYNMIRKVYRQVIVASLARKVQRKLYSREKARLGSLDIDVGIPMQIIASTNDPYTSLDCLRSIQEDFLVPDLYTLEYGHFPYSSANCELVRELIEHFEASPRALHAR
ncbi:alpha/beta hydrolase [Oligoflexus tunisiensis]|uniref:alpha/beta hydrolase n=1 Tax=Oligoflexus tunisiensis TaxID=708132 RepID=UPI00114CDF83|nr:alpha/beta hydrolase [Oligoflexus tunisiensis]